jgi:hypothetical protein
MFPLLYPYVVQRYEKSCKNGDNSPFFAIFAAYFSILLNEYEYEGFDFTGFSESQW